MAGGTHRLLENLPANVSLNVSGELISTELQTLKSVEGSILADVFSGMLPAAVDAADRPIIDAQPSVFKNMLKYLQEHRMWLPPAGHDRV